ncbi:hypothetical protein Y032_0046g1305 [Ancylostoma ceylanicum]|uniref:Protein arginine N-methyltransferase n=1 Tax=Ancylostoma ceylanicum TaxID=53326 RepID=A0A016UDC4_9BILA|nr:hypothetical protein Y032_0046g1305 [Ancylostoma ceylanicum]
MFLEKINHITGEREWEVAEEDHDLAQEIAVSRFADMILDYNRNDMFLAGLRAVIQEKKAQAIPAHVLDIGTGTGLLSLMAAREGADKVTAVEVFQPMADCARSIIQSSQWKDKINVISSRSTDLSSLATKPNIIVAEVFDTELIGEGALRTFKEALDNLVQPGCRVVPSRGRVWVVPVESEFLAKFNRIPRLSKGDQPLGDCPGTAAVYDVQLSQVLPHKFTRLSEPILAFSFDFESSNSIIYDQSFDRRVTCTESGQIDAILMWWDLDMDGTGAFWIDMAPKWASKDYHWRDHWMQAVYYLPHRVNVEKNQRISLKCSHDEFSMWFSIGEDCFERVYCSCQLHAIAARQTIFSMNELLENDLYRDEIKSVVSPRFSSKMMLILHLFHQCRRSLITGVFLAKTYKIESGCFHSKKKTVSRSKEKDVCEGRRVVVLGEGSLLFLLVAAVATSVTVVDSNPHFRDILERYISCYKLSNVKIVENTTDVSTDHDIVVGEPFYLSAMAPWQNLRFWYDVKSLRERLGSNVEVYPQTATLYGMCVRFDNLQNTAAPVGTVDGFDLSLFDDLSQAWITILKFFLFVLVTLITKARQATVALVDVHPLWEYSGVATSEKFEVLHFDLREDPSDLKVNFQLPLKSGTNGIPLWMEWHIGNYTVTTGMKKEPRIGEAPEWKEGVRQGVYLLSPSLLQRETIRVDVRFSREEGEVKFQFY